MAQTARSNGGLTEAANSNLPRGPGFMGEGHPILNGMRDYAFRLRVRYPPPPPLPPIPLWVPPPRPPAPPPPRPIILEVTFVQPSPAAITYPGFQPGQLKGNETLVVQAMDVEGNPNDQAFPTTVAQIAALASGPAPGGGALTGQLYTSNASPLILPAVTNVLTIINQATPAPLTIQLPPNPGNDMYLGIKDGGQNFAANPVTVVTTDGSQIFTDHPIPTMTLNITGMGIYFLSHGSLWYAT